MSRSQAILLHIAALVFLGGILFISARPEIYATVPVATNQIDQTAGVEITRAATSSLIAPIATTTAATSSTPAKKPPAKKAPVARSAPRPSSVPVAEQAATNQASRIQNPYSFSPFEFSAVNEMTRAALVNILCIAGSGDMRSITGSGIIIDPRGVILTNAHVAQYVLLSQSSDVNLSCMIRMGSPAIVRFKAETLYIPPVWVDAHVAEIRSQHALGTGEHDYALLRIVSSLDGTPLSAPLPYLLTDIREAIGFEGDSVLAASYPAEFSVSTQDNVYAASSGTTIKQLLTFDVNSVDLISLGGVIEAQSGSSGGAVANAWGRLIGIIVTTSEGQTTGQRDLHALTLGYINRDFTKQTGHPLSELLAGDIATIASDFNTNIAPILIAKYIGQLSR